METAADPSSLPASAFAALDSGAFASSALTRGPWDPGHQHAGPPIALVAGAIERAAAARGLGHLARLTANLLRPIPLGALRVEVDEDYAGRNVGLYAARLTCEGKELALFSALAQRELGTAVPADLEGHPLPRAPRAVADSPAARFPFLRGVVGYPDLVETRVAEGRFFRGACAAWFRLRRPLVAGETPTPLQRVAVAADSGNGISAVLDFSRYLFLNSDLTINLLRRPRGEWICIDARTLIGPDGAGLAEARIFDEDGLTGRSTQSLLVRARE